jgi:hypothetical protein
MGIPAVHRAQAIELNPARWSHGSGAARSATKAFDNLDNGPTWIVGANMRAAMQGMGSLSSNELVNLMKAASAAAMGTETA